MVKPAFENLAIDFWVHPGKLGVSQPSLCLFHDSVELGSQIVDALRELKFETWPAQRKLTFVACHRKRALQSLRLIAVPAREDLRAMSIRLDSDAATIEMTEQGLELLIQACTSWLAGAEDFGISPRRSALKSKDLGDLDRESGELWFWGPGYFAP